MKLNNCLYLLLIVTITLSSCKKFLNIDPPKTSVGTENVFRNNDLATSAVLNLYTSMISGQFASGSASISIAAGLSSDELIDHGSVLNEFYENQINPSDINLLGIYSTCYAIIFRTNSILEGLESSSDLTQSVKNQLKGETLFIRAFTYFYLVNLYGPIPLQLNSDYRVSRVTPNSPIDKIYLQIVSDLQDSEAVLTDQYVTTERVRVNLAAVQALLARVFLYKKDWINAEKYASFVIDKSSTYKLVGLENIFLKNSQEAILQLFPTVGSNGGDGAYFILTTTPSRSLRPAFAVSGFEANDKRQTSWVKSFTNNTGTYYYPFKYKIQSSSSQTEYTMLLRLAEQYLIRAEARTEQNKLGDAIDDLDKIRDRAGLPLLKITSPLMSKADLLIAVQKERKVELFSEWGHRWFDLKRTDKATEVLKPLKPKWQSDDMLYPIPEDEINRNPNISQNQGY